MYAKTKNIIFKIVLFALVFSNVAYANGDTPISNGLSYFIDAMFGATGISIATIAVIGAGIACLFQVLRWTWLFSIVIGISGVFGADAIVHAIVSLVHFS